MKQLTLIAFVCIACMNVSLAQPGTLDSSFGVEGKVTTSQTKAVLHSTTSLLQKDGKIILGGYRGIQDISDSLREGFLFIRYMANGKIDSSFGENGMQIVRFGYSAATVASMAEQKDGKIIACGRGFTGYPVANYNGLITRLNKDGSIDSSFGENGKVIYDSNLGQDEFAKLLLREDGSILICGDISLYAALLLQFLPDGKLDSNFGDSGVVKDRSISYPNILDAVLQQDGKIVIAGAYYNPGRPASMLVGRYLSNGTIDNSFGNKGKTITALPGYSESFRAIAIQEDGKIIGAGNSNGFNDKATLVRYTKDGIIDESFGENGVVYTDYTKGQSSVNDIVIQPDGKIITAVYNHDDIIGYSNFAANRYNTNGSLDTSFGENGTVLTSVFANDFPTSLLLQPDGKIVICGDTYIEFNSALALARYNGDAPEKNKYLRIKHWLHHHGITWEDKPNNLINYYSIQSSTNGNAFTEVARIFSNHNGGIQTYTASSNATANYRIAAVSNTGNITYSNTLTLTATPTIQLYPNPAKNNLQIQGLPAGTTKLTVTDISGNTKIIATTNSTVYRINIAQLTSGNYLLHIKTANEVITKQFIKE